ncbi:MAG TPA: metallophosphoesterase [Phycisphaerae bacterium]|nr:metallophosphoesterase [Phycisphaerae bacterium]HOJ74742.1 metallophosphoesterase [Phycisphaerae bacterium]HOM52111.1 metallophosphoesterase [Phycisphaerae bacterium]HON69103.1 metallophosphoesterase [Phycisphaerae bacterium]HOQ87234.1 metallophosphoesterase [Phycisphaerae bacterium]
MILRTNHPRRVAACVLALTAAITGGTLAWRFHAQPVLVLGPMVQQVSTDSFAVFCKTSGDPGDQTFRAPEAGKTPTSQQVIAELFEDGRAKCTGTVVPLSDNRFIITFSGLEPARTYDYEIRSPAGVRLARYTVRTAPADDRPFRFVALGDTGVGDRHQYRIARRMQKYRPDLILHTGDLIYPRGRLEDNPRKFFQPYGELLPEVPVYVALGNHEYRMPGVDPLSDAFVLPPNGPAGAPAERSYWFDYGSARFIAIDSNNDEPFFAETVAPWLDEVMRSAGDRWKILFFHEPVHTQAKYPPADKLLSTIVPVLETHGAHLVLCGHNHLFERTHPVRDGRVVGEGEGTIYVTTGAGGANLADVRLPMPDTIAVWEDREHSFTVADVTRDVLRLRQIGESGRLIDEYHIQR